MMLQGAEQVGPSDTALHLTSTAAISCYTCSCLPVWLQDCIPSAAPSACTASLFHDLGMSAPAQQQTIRACPAALAILG